jgi:hypothetical protein
VWSCSRNLTAPLDFSHFVEHGPSILSRPLRQPLPSRQRGCCNLLRNLTDLAEKISASSYSKPPGFANIQDAGDKLVQFLNQGI